VVADASLADEAHAMTVQLAAGPTKALGAAKRLMHRGFSDSRKTVLWNARSVSPGLRVCSRLLLARAPPLV
jgi:hypothetical protein